MKPQVANENILDTDINGAMHDMIKISQKLLTIAETETQKLVQNDLLGFAMLQDEKEDVTQDYVQASEEFRHRVHEFHGVDQTLLERLNSLQSLLGEKTKSNTIIVERMKHKAEATTKEALQEANKIAQEKVVRFKNNLMEMAQISQEDQTVGQEN